jgi:Sulfatase
MIEDTDTWIGELMKVLKARGQWDNTMIVFTSDHGEMLGAHGFGGKQVLLEEAIRIPLIMKLPSGAANRIRRVDEPVSHLDIFSTILDYLGAPASADRSDGRSLRRLIENQSYNERWDESVVVCEYDERNPISATQLSGKLGSAPAFSMRKGPFKLILPRQANSTVLDMMYNLGSDPYVARLRQYTIQYIPINTFLTLACVLVCSGEVRNLLSRGAKASDAVVGKAEHLKALLIDYMTRLDGPGYYSNKRYDNNEGRGDTTEVYLRRTWRRVPFWVSDGQLKFGQLVERELGVFVRYEYLYFGRTTSGTFTVQQISLSGPSMSSFSIDSLSSWPVRTRTVGNGQYLRIQVRFQSPVAVDMTQVTAYLTVATSAGTKVVRLGG